MERDYIKQGDCLQLMDELPEKSIDMILCDLPYGETNNPRDRPLPFGALWRQYKRIIKSNGAVLLFGQGKFFIDLAASNREWYRYDLIWDKVLTTGFLNAKRMPLRRHEKIAVFYNRLPTYHPQYETGHAAARARESVSDERVSEPKLRKIFAIGGYAGGKQGEVPDEHIAVCKAASEQGAASDGKAGTALGIPDTNLYKYGGNRIG